LASVLSSHSPLRHNYFEYVECCYALPCLQSTNRPNPDRSFFLQRGVLFVVTLCLCSPFGESAVLAMIRCGASPRHLSTAYTIALAVLSARTTIATVRTTSLGATTATAPTLAEIPLRIHLLGSRWSCEGLLDFTLVHSLVRKVLASVVPFGQLKIGLLGPEMMSKCEG
jgi:hypothetical protein